MARKIIVKFDGNEDRVNYIPINEVKREDVRLHKVFSARGLSEADIFEKVRKRYYGEVYWYSAGNKYRVFLPKDRTDLN